MNLYNLVFLIQFCFLISSVCSLNRPDVKNDYALMKLIRNKRGLGEFINNAKEKAKETIKIGVRASVAAGKKINEAACKFLDSAETSLGKDLNHEGGLRCSNERDAKHENLSTDNYDLAYNLTSNLNNNDYSSSSTENYLSANDNFKKENQDNLDKSIKSNVFSDWINLNNQSNTNNQNNEYFNGINNDTLSKNGNYIANGDNKNLVNFFEKKNENGSEKLNPLDMGSLSSDNRRKSSNDNSLLNFLNDSTISFNQAADLATTELPLNKIIANHNEKNKFEFNEGNIYFPNGVSSSSTSKPNHLSTSDQFKSALRKPQNDSIFPFLSSELPSKRTNCRCFCPSNGPNKEFELISDSEINVNAPYNPLEDSVNSSGKFRLVKKN